MIDISIEVTTYNRKEVLRDLLLRLASQTCPVERFEVVLSDDGSTDGLLEMVEEMVSSLPYKLTLLRHVHQGPGHGHNRGIEACESDLVIMLAADILPSPELVLEHLRSHRENPEPNVVVSGRITQSKALPQTVVQLAANVEVEKVFLSESKQVEHGGFLVSNLSFKKSFMQEYGMLLEWPPASGEDLELGYRLKNNGMQIIENELALGFHHHQETLRSVSNRAYMTGFNSHHFSAEVDEAWVRRRFGFPEPSFGVVARLRAMLRIAARTVIVNRFTTKLLMIPIIRAAQSVPVLIPLTPMLLKKMAAYFFKRGLADFRSARPFHLPNVRN